MSPRNSARTPVTTCLSGLMSDSRCSQVVAVDVGAV